MRDKGRRRSPSVPAAVAAACCLGAAVASVSSAQTAQNNQTPAQPPRTPYGREPAENQPQRKPVHNNAATEAGALYQKSGGSLLRASLAAPPDANQAKLSQVSYTALPDPEPKTIRKHDLITIVIHEESAFTSKETSDLKRAADMNAELDAWARLNLSRLELSPTKIGAGGAVPQVKMQASRNFTGDGSVDRSDTLTARITGEVVDVKPNGTLVLQARKQIRTDEEEQQFVLTGTCRAEDVGADNTVLSTQMYDLRLQKNHKGTVREANKRTWLQQLFDVVSPF